MKISNLKFLFLICATNRIFKNLKIINNNSFYCGKRGVVISSSLVGDATTH